MHVSIQECSVGCARALYVSNDNLLITITSRPIKGIGSLQIPTDGARRASEVTDMWCAIKGIL